MPDLTEMVAPVCATVQQFRTRIDGNVVDYGETPYGRYRYGWDCVCEDFNARDTCDHIRKAEEMRCGWNRYLDPQPIPAGNVCPDCGGPLAFVKVAV